jgi:hypothetical protein
MPNENMDNEIAYLNLYPEGIYRQNVERNFEAKAYEKVIKDSAESSINIYIKYFPSGKNLKNVIIVSLKKHKNLYLIRKFIKDYPNSKYLSMAKKKYVEIWNNTLHQFDKKVNSKRDQFDNETIEACRELLFYIRENTNITMNLDIFPSELDINEFPNSSRRFLISKMLNGYWKSYFDNRTRDSRLYSSSNIDEINSEFKEKIKTNMKTIFGYDVFNFIDAKTIEINQIPNDQLYFIIHYDIIDGISSTGKDMKEDNDNIKANYSYDANFKIIIKIPGRPKIYTIHYQNFFKTDCSFSHKRDEKSMDELNSCYFKSLLLSLDEFINRIPINSDFISF